MAVTSSANALRDAARRAVLAPSVHNTQPWRFVLRPQRLDVFVDPSRQLSVLDPSGRQMYLSVGCALMNARVALAAAGQATQVARLPEVDRPDLAARIMLGGDEPADRSLAALNPVIELRQTNRRRFADDAVPDQLVAALVAAAAAEGAVLHPIVNADDRSTLARLSQRADTMQIADPAYRAELRSWTNNDPARRDGVRAAVVPHVDGTAGDEIPIRDFDSQGVGGLPAETHSSAGQCLLILGTKADNPEAWMRGGEALERVWLEVTRAGFVASLFTQVIEIGGLRDQLSEELQLGMRPHVVLRVGRAPLTAASMRRHLEDVLDDEAQASR
jgi:nitroreductase